MSVSNATLHCLNKKQEFSQFFLSSGDAVIYIEESVYELLDSSLVQQYFDTGITVFALKEDLMARGLLDKLLNQDEASLLSEVLPAESESVNKLAAEAISNAALINKIHIVDYAGFVELSCFYKKVLSLF